MQNEVQRYGAAMQALHWLTAVLVLAAFALGPEEEHGHSAGPDLGTQWHETLGMTVLALSVLRVLVALFSRRPAVAYGPPLMALAARLVKLALYGLLFAVPLSAIVGSWLDGHALTLLGGIEVAPPAAFGASHSDWLLDVHEFLGDAILWVAGLHAAAGIFHHVVMRDAALTAMLPAPLARWLGQRP